MKILIKKIILHLEKILRLDIKYLLKNGGLLSISSLIGTIVALLSAIAFANFLDPVTYGIYKFIATFAALLTAFSLSGSASSIVKHTAQKQEVFFLVFKNHLKWNTLPISIAICGSIYYYINENVILATGLLLLAIFDPLTKSLKLSFAHLSGKKNFKAVAVLGTVQNIVTSTAIVLLIYNTGNAIIVCAGYFISHFLISLIIFFYIYATQKPLKKTVENTSLAYAKHLSVMNFLSNIAKHIDQIIVFNLLGASSLAIYVFSRMPIKEIQRIDGILKNILLPKLSERTLKEIKTHILRKVVIFFFLLLLIVVLYTISAPFLFQKFFPQYIEAVKYTQIFIFEILFTPSILLTQSLVAHEKTNALYIKRTVAPLVKIVLLLILIPLYGLYGVAFSMILTRAIDSTLTAILFLRET